jgi:SAM-dependent methyltransferase
MPRHARSSGATAVALTFALLASPHALRAQQRTTPFQPEVGQAGKDVVWVPSPEETVEKMMEMAKLTPADFVVDLGSGDGRNVIAAAKRGARGLGVEYNPDMVELSKRRATEAGVAERAQFVQGDMFVADFSKATVLALFLLPSNLLQLRSKFLELQPGTRMVLNTFSIQDWLPDETVTLENCSSWCTVMLYVVPARVSGTWRTPQGELTLKQEYQVVTGTLAANGAAIPVKGRLNGNAITLTSDDNRTFAGRVTGSAIEGTASAGGANTGVACLTLTPSPIPPTESIDE